MYKIIFIVYVLSCQFILCLWIVCCLSGTFLFQVRAVGGGEASPHVSQVEPRHRRALPRPDAADDLEGRRETQERVETDAGAREQQHHHRRRLQPGDNVIKLFSFVTDDEVQ